MEMTCCGPVSDCSTSDAGGAFAHGADEVPDDAEVDVRLEQSNTYLAKGLVEVLLAYGAVA